MCQCAQDSRRREKTIRKKAKGEIFKTERRLDE